MSQGLITSLLALGGGMGAVLRYLTGLFFMKRYSHPPIPIAMLVVNAGGSIGLGLLYGKMYDEPSILYTDPLFIVIGIGFFGAFTTFSTFSVEAVQLLKEKLYIKGAIYITSSILGSILGFTLGFNING